MLFRTSLPKYLPAAILLVNPCSVAASTCSWRLYTYIDYPVAVGYIVKHIKNMAATHAL